MSESTLRTGMTSSVTVGSFSPSSIANCVQWLDASDMSTLFQNSSGTTPVTANGQNVAFWRDKSGSNNSVFQNGTIPVPTYCNVLIASQPGLDFTNSSLLWSSNFQNSSNITTFIVGAVKNTITGWGVFWGHFPNNDHDNYISVRNTSGQTVINWHTANDNSVMQLPYLLDSPVIYYGIMSNRFNTFFSQTNTAGTTTVSNNIGGTIVSASIPTWIGQSRVQSEAIRSHISEIIYYQRVLTTFEQQQVQAYLAWKYRLQTFLPATNPYQTAPFLMINSPIQSIPPTLSLIPINTYSTIKTLTLPVVSTNPGRLLILKDFLGSASTNPIYLSTTGLDRIERTNISSMVLRNSYGAWTFMNDGFTNWFLLNAYANDFVTIGPSLATAQLSVIPAVRYSFASENYSGTGNVNNIGSNTAIGSATVSVASYTSTSPGFITTNHNTGHYVQAPSQTIQTIIMIVRITNGGPEAYLLDAREGLGQGWMWNGQLGPDWVGQTYYRDTVLTTIPNNVPGSLQDNTWHHVCFIRPAFTDNVTYLARFSQSESIAGNCGEIMAFSQALTQTEVINNYNFFASRFGWSPV